MPIVRMIHVRVPSGQSEQARENWKKKCAPLMIKQEGCLSEEMLRNTEDDQELISYSEWDSEESIQRYLDSEDHQEIKRHNSEFRDADVEVKHYELVR